MAESYKFSVLEYTPISKVDGSLSVKKQVVIPLIQSISIKIDNNIITKPTVTGKTIAQTTTVKPITVTLDILIQTNQPTYTYLGAALTTAELLSDLRAISDDVLVFDLITTDKNLSPYLSNLVVVSKSFTKSSGNRNTITCTLTCTEIRFAKIGWGLVPKVEVLGVEATNEEDTTKIVKLSMVMNFDGEQKFKFHKYINYLNDTPPELTGEFICAQRAWSDVPPYYLSLSAPIDLKSGNTTYIIDTPLSLAIWGDTEDGVRRVNPGSLGLITVKVNSNDSVSIQPTDVHLYPTSLSVAASLNIQNVYDIYNQYKGFSVNEIFDKFISQAGLAREIILKRDNGFITTIDDFNNGNYKSSEHLISTITSSSPTASPARYLMAKSITQLYAFNIYDKNSSSKTIISGTAQGFRAKIVELDTFKAPQVLGGTIHSLNTDLFSPNSPKAYLFTVAVGTKLYLFIFSTDIFKDDILARVESV